MSDRACRAARRRNGHMKSGVEKRPIRRAHARLTFREAPSFPEDRVPRCAAEYHFPSRPATTNAMRLRQATVCPDNCR
ncbi:MAG: hypothetical protein NZ553_12275, partial [Caldilinea sp.]|nr:hypothetical protein [Caldilinea sp.]MDW8441244.1 hypothetical protein [Caldilineaceae bacterium]